MNESMGDQKRKLAVSKWFSFQLPTAGGAAYVNTCKDGDETG